MMIHAYTSSVMAAISRTYLILRVCIHFMSAKLSLSIVHGHAGLIASVGFPWVRVTLEALVPYQPARLKGKPEIYIARDPKGIPASKTSKFEVSGELGEFSKVVWHLACRCLSSMLWISCSSPSSFGAEKSLATLQISYDFMIWPQLWQPEHWNKTDYCAADWI